VLKRIVTSENVIDKKINESTSFDIGKVADRIAEELKLTKSRKYTNNNIKVLLSGEWRNDWETTMKTLYLFILK
jgi:hypothetical protein